MLYLAGGWCATCPIGGGEKERGDFTFPGDTEWHPGSDGAAQWAECKPETGEHGAGRQTQEAYWAVWAQRGGETYGTKDRNWKHHLQFQVRNICGIN